MFSLQEANFASKLLRKGQSHIFLHFEALVHHLPSFLFSFTVLLRFSTCPWGSTKARNPSQACVKLLTRSGSFILYPSATHSGVSRQPSPCALLCTRLKTLTRTKCFNGCVPCSDPGAPWGIFFSLPLPLSFFFKTSSLGNSAQFKISFCRHQFLWKTKNILMFCSSLFSYWTSPLKHLLGVEIPE